MRKCLCTFLGSWLVLVLAAGCAYSPQQVRILPVVPDVDATAKARYSGSVAVRGADQRSSEVIGTRGGIYEETSVITLASGTADALAQTFVSGLAQLGFAVGGTAPTEVEVALRKLVLDRSKDGLKYNTAARAELRVRGWRGDETFSGDFHGEVSYSDVTSPGADDIANYLNEAVNIAIAEALRDRQLAAFIGAN